MSESCGAPLKTSPDGIQGLAMMAPIVGLPVGIVLGGALVAVTGIAVTVAPIAVPLAAPFLYKAVSNGGFDAVVKKLFAAPGKAAAVQKVVINVPGLTRSEAAPVVQSAIQENV
ncbi:MAG: hypothetical protein HGB16_00295 [Chlorobaculum sp.]|nr:hypothetical protein [Chlorobaculum sp.]